MLPHVAAVIEHVASGAWTRRHSGHEVMNARVESLNMRRRNGIGLPQAGHALLNPITLDVAVTG